MKKICTGPAISAKERENAEKEMLVLQKFTHPHVVKYHDSFQTEAHTCIVMEYCEHGSLDDMINERRKTGTGPNKLNEIIDAPACFGIGGGAQFEG
jgi:serine/threonine protein kinase